MPFRTIIVGAICFILLIFSIVAQEDDPAMAESIEAGRAIYRSHGCTSCHGLEGEGSSVAPPLADSTVAIIRRQIRAPLGIMPNFTPEEISSEELDDLVNYILTIENFDLGLYDGERLQRVIGEEVILRHWMILTALEVEDTETAIGHVEFILEYVEDEHQEHMEEVLALLESGENHDAQHIVETMIADVGDVDGSESTFHLRLLVSAVRAEDYEEAHHHYEHYMSLDDHDADIAELLNVLFEGENYDEIVILLDGIIVDAEIEADEESHDDEHNHDDHSHEDDRQD